MANEPHQGPALSQHPHQGEAHNGPRHRDEPPGWFDDPANLDRIFYALVGISIILLLIDPLLSRHGSFAIESFWGFYGIFGLVSGAVLVLGAMLLRRIVMRPEDYYDQ